MIRVIKGITMPKSTSSCTEQLKLRADNLITCPWCYGSTPYNDDLMQNHCNHCRKKITDSDLEEYRRENVQS